MKVKVFFASLVLFVGVAAHAQLSQRTDDPSSFKFGTRPQMGDWGVNFQLYAIDPGFKNYFNEIPIINVQYYVSNTRAYRVGLRFSKHKTVFSGESNENLFNPNNYSSFKHKDADREYMIYGGMEEHFAPTNLLDVYIGGQIPFGYSSYVNLNEAEFIGGGKSNTVSRTTGLLYGLEAFIGIQTFISDLPIAVGAEWGFAGYGKLFNRTYNLVETTTSSTEFYTVDGNPTEFKSVNSRKFDMDNMVRFRISYYFNK